MGSALAGLGLFVLFVAAGVALDFFLDRRPPQSTSMRRISLAWDPVSANHSSNEYELGRIGKIRFEGGWDRAVARTADETWQFEGRGRSVVTTTTDAGGPIGEYDCRRGILRWHDRELSFLRGFGRRPSVYRKHPFLARDGRYVLAENGRIVAFLRSDGHDFRVNPMNIEIVNTAEAEAGLLLLAAFVGAREAQRDRNNDGL